MDELKRTAPVRVSLVAVNVALFVFVVVAIGIWDVPAGETFQGLMWVSGVIGAAILGDTWRPSGRIRQNGPSPSVQV